MGVKYKDRGEERHEVSILILSVVFFWQSFFGICFFMFLSFFSVLFPPKENSRVQRSILIWHFLLLSLLMMMMMTTMTTRLREVKKDSELFFRLGGEGKGFLQQHKNHHISCTLSPRCCCCCCCCCDVDKQPEPIERGVDLLFLLFFSLSLRHAMSGSAMDPPLARER